MADVDLQPMRVGMTTQEVAERFVKIKWTENPEAGWHFEVALPKDIRRGPSGKEAPAVGKLVSVGLFNRESPMMDVEILGTVLEHEIDPSDWLDWWVQGQGMKVLLRKEVPTMGGAIGDVVVEWEVGGRKFMARLVAMKAGNRLAVQWFRTAAEDYAACAPWMIVTISSFRFLEMGASALAENVRWVSADVPVPWKTPVPASWEVMGEAPSGRVGSFQATLLGPEVVGAERVMLAKLSFAVLAPEVVKDLEYVLERMKAALTDAGVSVGELKMEKEAMGEPWLEGWFGGAEASVGGVAAEVRSMVLRREKVWVAGLVLIPKRETAAGLWMRGKRVLDVAVRAMEFQ